MKHKRPLTASEAAMALKYVQRVVARGPNEENDLWHLVRRLSELSERRGQD